MEWVLLQHLATFGDCFSINDVFIKLADGSNVFKENNTLKFSRHFDRLKNAGYLVMIPVAFISVGKDARPSYKLTSLGKKVTQQYK